MSIIWPIRKKVTQNKKTALLKNGEILILRRMELDDLPTIVELEHLIFPDPWSEDNFRHEITQNQFCLALVAEWQREIVGYVISWLLGDEIRIANIAVSPLYRRLGIGKILLNTILDEGWQHGGRRAFLEVRRSNLAAIALYQKYGFRKVGVRKKYYRNGEDAILMEKQLSPDSENP